MRNKEERVNNHNLYDLISLSTIPINYFLPELKINYKGATSIATSAVTSGCNLI